MLKYLNKIYNKIKNSKIKNSKNSFKIIGNNKILPIPHIYIFGLFILSMLLLVSATSIANDTGDSKLYTDNNGTIFNLTATPHRLNDTNAYISLNLQSDNKTNKVFKVNNDQNITLSDNTNNTINTSLIDINGLINGDTINKHLNISDDGNDTILDVKFNNIELNPLNEIQPYNGVIITVNNSSNTAIQDAINDANASDIIQLDSGEYIEYNINVNKTGLTIKAKEGLTPEDVIVNANGTGRVFDVNVSNVNFNGLTIKNGNSSTIGGGGGISAAATATGLYVFNCNITNNAAGSYDGGGVYIVGSGSVISCNITNNTANLGGGVRTTENKGFNRVDNCNITDNKVITSGGGVSLGDGGNSLVINCRILNNSANGNADDNAIGGGGVHFNSPGSVVNCSIIDNVANRNGGGVHCNLAGSSVVNCSILNNRANYDGGGVYVRNLNYYGSDTDRVVNCSITNNNATRSGGGVYVNTNLVSVLNCSILNNRANYDGGGVYNKGTLKYCRILNNTGTNGKEVNNPSGIIDFNWWGQNNINDLINGTKPNSYYMVQLGAGDNKTTVNKNYICSFFPVDLSYGLVLNGTNISAGVDELPDFDKELRFGNLTNLFTTPLKESILKPNSLLGIPIKGLDLPFNRFDIPIGNNSSAKLPYYYTLNDNDSIVFEALVDNEDLNINLLASKLPTVTNFTNVSVNHEDKTLTINGTLKYNISDNIIPLDGVDLNVSIDGEDNGTINTDNNGVFNYISPFIVPGNHTINISFLETEFFGSSSDIWQGEVNKTNISFINLNSAVNPDHSVRITGDIIDEFNDALSDVDVSLNMSDDIVSTFTNSSGGFIFNIPAGLSPGDYSYCLNATENVTHNGAIFNGSFTILTYDTNLTLSTPQIFYGDSAVFIANLTNSSGEAINNKEINFSVNGEFVGSNQTNTDGIAVLNNYTPSNGTYTVNALFNGDENYSKSDANSTLNVGKWDTNLSINKIIANLGQKTTITGNLNDSTGGLDNKAVIINITNNLGQSNIINRSVITNGTGGFNISFIPEKAGKYTVTAVFEGDDYYNLSYDSINFFIAKPPTNYDAVINKTVNVTTPPNIGDFVKYTITVTNLGDSQVVNVMDILDDRLIYISSNPNGSYDHNTGLWNIGELGVDETVNLDIIVKVNGSGNITNLAILNTPNEPPKNDSVNITVNPHINSDKPPINLNGYNFDLKNTGIPILVFLVLISIIGGTIYRKRK
ncbi:MAG: DUF11 domain-containing protein [Methanobrevibacter sp.]|jgi:hypothetical protein|nr:DUF11 domain-containing protein [Candidatus Methanovirga meridionalis]